MIKEIVQFTKALPEETFSKNLQLKEGLYMFLKNINGQLEINEEKTLLVKKNSERNWLFDEYLLRYSYSKMISRKTMNAREKIFIDIGSPFAISISGKGLKPNSTENEEERRKKQESAIEAYFKAISGYIDFEREGLNKQEAWSVQFKDFVENQMMDYFKSNGSLEKVKNNWEYTLNVQGKGKKIGNPFVFYFFMEEPEIDDYNLFYNRYLSQKVFLNDLKEGEIYGISNDLNIGNADSKIFLRHKTACFELNHKVDGNEATAIYKFFQLKKANKILPNPCPIFVDKDEINKDVVRIHKDGEPYKYAELLKYIFTNHSLEKLQNYYLIFFDSRKDKSQVVDIDFIPVYEYSLKIELENIFELVDKGKELLPSMLISNRFQLEQLLSDKIFYQISKNSGFSRGIIKEHYFSDKVEPPKGWFISEVVKGLTYQYRKAIYDYIYKSRQQSITCAMFDRIMSISILEDIRIDEFNNGRHTRGYAIKEKLNIWFSLYIHFSQNQNRENMATNVKKHKEMIRQIIEGSFDELEFNEQEFAFTAGQVLYYILDKSKSGDKSFNRLEPFLQKTNYSDLLDAIVRIFDMYKHENFSNNFKRPYAWVLDFDYKEKSIMPLKKLMPNFLAGFFADNQLYSDSKK